MGKLKSRKFWICIALMGYGAIMGIRALNIDNDSIVTIVCVVGAIAAGIGYIFAEAMVDAEDAAVIVDTADEAETDEEEAQG